MEETERRKGVNHLCMHWLKTEMASFIYSIYIYAFIIVIIKCIRGIASSVAY